MTEETDDRWPLSYRWFDLTDLLQSKSPGTHSELSCEFHLLHATIHAVALEVVPDSEEFPWIARRLRFSSSQADMAKRQRRGGETSQREDLARSAAGRDLDPRRKDEVLSVVKTLKRTGVGRRGSIVADPNLLLCNS